jgi:hypothetical protein
MVCSPATSEAGARRPRREERREDAYPPRLGRLAPASEVAGGHTLPFKNWHLNTIFVSNPLRK